MSNQPTFDVSFPTSDIYTLTSLERQKYTEYWSKATKENEGFMSASEARDLFSKSGIEPSDLAKIWRVSDVNKDMKLDLEEFIISMHLIYLRKRGVPVPDTLPESLVPSTKQVHQPIVSHSSDLKPLSPLKGATTDKRAKELEEKYGDFEHLNSLPVERLKELSQLALQLLSQVNNAILKKDDCVACGSNRKVIVCVPCGHCNMCEKCSGNLNPKQCIVCHSPIEKLQKIIN